MKVILMCNHCYTNDVFTYVYFVVATIQNNLVVKLFITCMFIEHSPISYNAKCTVKALLGHTNEEICLKNIEH